MLWHNLEPLLQRLANHEKRDHPSRTDTNRSLNVKSGIVSHLHMLRIRWPNHFFMPVALCSKFNAYVHQQHLNLIKFPPLYDLSASRSMHRNALITSDSKR